MCISEGESLYLSSATPAITASMLQIGLLLAPVGILATSAIKSARHSGTVRRVSLAFAVASLTWLINLCYWYIFQTDGCGGWLITGSSFYFLVVGYPAILGFWLAGQLLFFRRKIQERIDLYALFCVGASIVTILYALSIAMQGK